MVKNQQGSAAEVWQIKASENFALQNLPQSREKSSTEKPPRSAPGTQALLAPTPLRGVMPLRGMPGACHNGTVKVQQRSATEP
jgi:hypothetical protein